MASYVARRRFLATLLGGAVAAWPLAARAQQARKVPRVGLLSTFSPSDAMPWHQAFRQGLRELGWVEGENISIEYRYAEARLDRLPDLATDLVRLNVDLIFTDTPSPAFAGRNATRTIPIVIASGSDLVASGLAESLARPGGNITGLDQIAPELGGKRLELLKETVPKLSRVVVLWNPQNQTSTRNWNELQDPARQLGVALHSLEVRSADELDKAFEVVSMAHADALVILPESAFVANLKRIADFSAKNRLPSIFHLREFADAGGLMTYGPDGSDLFRRAAAYVDKILKGAKPADLPIQLPTKFEFVINLKTAKALGLEIPPTLLARADEVIE
jgi:putative tryptophan/tyrosine transport system substrate-binding protein